MKKRSNAVVVLSSDDDDNNDNKNRSILSNSKPNRTITNPKSSYSKAKTSNAKSSRKKKKARVSNNSLSDSVDLFSTFDDLKFLTEDIAEGFAGFKVSTGIESGSKKADGTESWVDKYRPRSLDELCVHKKKVEEVKTWLEDKLTNAKQGSENYVLLITGQAGIGKSATIHVIASHLGVEVCEWNTPTPTLWQEHVHNLNAGLRYISKLDEFENFVERVRKYGIMSSSVSGSSPSMVFLIEDLPAVHGKIAHGRLRRCLELLVASAQIPTVILVTEFSGADYSDVSLRYWDELSSTLESAGACKVAFNPVTNNSIKKALSKICRQEQCNTTSEEIDLIASASGGDIRHAIMTLQYFCLRQRRNLSYDKCYFDAEAKALNCDQQDGGPSLQLGRDQTLSLFHALGKFLHNKRETDCTMEHNNNDFYLKEGFTRLPLKMDAPETVLSQAYGQARPVAEFLHENGQHDVLYIFPSVLDFLSQEAIEDAWTVTTYLSDADCLLSSSHRAFSRNYEADNIIQSAAASVAVRGVLFGNSHASPSRWHSIRRPMLWKVDQSARRNMHEIERQRLDNLFGCSLSNVSTFCIEFKPALKWLGRASSILDSSDYSLQDDEMDMTSSLDRTSECTDDEIEDW